MLDYTPVTELFKTDDKPGSLGIVRSAVYARAKRLGVTFVERGGKAYVSNLDLQLMIDYGRSITDKRRNEFLSELGRSPAPAANADMVMNKFYFLEQAAQQDWRLSESDLQALFGAVESDRFVRNGFTFGMDENREWTVGKSK